MTAYKFRPASSMEFTFDILLNRRLYCADWKTLNDPMEGSVVYSYDSSDPNRHQDKLEKLLNETQRLRVCSLSKTFDCHLLWAHYASGFTGVAIEVDIPDNSPVVRELRYRGVYAFVPVNQLGNPKQSAMEILSSKYSEWEYEKEVRILQESEWFSDGLVVKRVITGTRMNPSLFEALRIVCQNERIEISTLGVGDEGLDADYYDIETPVRRPIRR